MATSIKPKIGKCIDCPDDSENKHLIAGRCEIHYKIHRSKINAEKNKDKPKPQQKRIPQFSARRKIENPKYTRNRLQFLSLPENHRCFIEGCDKRATTIEHIRGREGFADEWARENNISLYLDVRFWKPCCLEHNLELERNSELSEKYQLSKISGKQKIIKR